MPRRPFGPLAALLLTASAVAGSPLAAQTPERFTLHGADAAVYDPAGRVQVVAGSGSDVVVEVTRQGRDAGRLRIVSGDARGQDALRIVAPAGALVYPALRRGSRTSFQVRSDGTFGGDDGGSMFGGLFSSDRITVRGDGDGTQAWADVVVRVPAGHKVTVQMGAGAVTAQNVDGQLTVGTRGGDVQTEHTRGRLTVGSGSGDVRVREADGDQVKVGTGSGDVEVRGVRAARVDVGTGSGNVTGGTLDGQDVRVGTGSGNVHLDLIRARTLRIGTGSGDADVGLAGELQQAQVGTGSGDVTLRVPTTFGASLDLTTGNGDVRSDLPLQVTQQNAHHLIGRIGDGRASIKVSTGSGGVHVVPAR